MITLNLTLRYQASTTHSVCVCVCEGGGGEPTFIKKFPASVGHLGSVWCDSARTTNSVDELNEKQCRVNACQAQTT